MYVHPLANTVVSSRANAVSIRVPDGYHREFLTTVTDMQGA